MKISEIRDERSVEVLGDLIEPVVRICKNEDVRKAAGSNVSLELAKAMIKADPHSVLEILAICNQVPLSEYHPNPFEVLRDLASVLSDPAISVLFFSQEPKEAKTASGSVTEDTQEEEKQKDS